MSVGSTTQYSLQFNFPLQIPQLTRATTLVQLTQNSPDKERATMRLTGQFCSFVGVWKWLMGWEEVVSLEGWQV